MTTRLPMTKEPRKPLKTIKLVTKIAEPWQTGVRAIMQAKGLDEQDAIEYAMSRTGYGRGEMTSKNFAFRVGRLHLHRHILTDESLGKLYYKQSASGFTWAYRQKEGKCSTSFVRVRGTPPSEWVAP